jgi:ankyrin repeat protein
MLLKHGADINAPKLNGDTPLHAASINGHTEIVRLLLEHGADRRACYQYGQTPSDMDVKQVIIQLLSDYGGNPTK